MFFDVFNKVDSTLEKSQQFNFRAKTPLRRNESRGLCILGVGAGRSLLFAPYQQPVEVPGWLKKPADLSWSSNSYPLPREPIGDKI